MAKAHKKSLFERQIPVIPLRNCESKNLSFKGETSGIKINIKIHYLSRDLLRSMVTNQGAFEQQDLYSTYGFERSMDRHHHVLISNYLTSLLPNCLEV